MLRAGDEPVPGYRLEFILGRGGFGQVWRATGPGRTPVALKFISLSDKHGLKEYRAIQRVKEIRHAHLLPIHAFWMLDDQDQLLQDDVLGSFDHLTSTGRDVAQPPHRKPMTLVVAMTLADGNLFDLLLPPDDQQQRMQVTRGDLLRYVEDSARAVDYLNSPRHDLGSGPVAIQHCDIKPQNIVLVGDSAMVCDFGLARVLTDSHVSSHLSGTPLYMAPECISGEGPSDRTDQYALAITYYYLRTGHPPFDTDAYMEVLTAHVQGKLSLDALPDAERQVIRQATSLRPADRFRSCTEMVRQLQQAVGTASPWHSVPLSGIRRRGSDGPTQPLSESAVEEGDLPLSKRLKLALVGAMATMKATHWTVLTTIHLWIGMTYLEHGVLCTALRRQNIDPAATRRKLREAIRIEEDGRSALQQGVSDNVTAALKEAVQIARRRGAHEVDEQHLLIALTALPEASATQLLRALQIDVALLARSDAEEESMEQSVDITPASSAFEWQQQFDAAAPHSDLAGGGSANAAPDLLGQDGYLELSGFSPECQGDLERACRLAHQFKQSELQPVHLLLGIATRPGSRLQQLLQQRSIARSQLFETFRTAGRTIRGGGTPQLHRDYLARDTLRTLRQAAQLAASNASLVDEQLLLAAIFEQQPHLRQQLLQLGISLDANLD